MLPHSYRDLFSYLISRGHLASNLNICHILDIASPLAIFRHLCQIRHCCQILLFSPKSPPAKGPLLRSNLNRQPSGKFCHFRHSARGPVVFAICSKFAIFAKLAIFAQIAIIAEIATLQGATFGMQFESPLHAFLEISATSRPKII